MAHICGPMEGCGGQAVKEEKRKNIFLQTAQLERQTSRSDFRSVHSATMTIWTNLEYLRRLCCPLMIFVIDFCSLPVLNTEHRLLYWRNRFVGRCLHWLTCLFGQRGSSPPCSVQVDEAVTDGRSSLTPTDHKTLMQLQYRGSAPASSCWILPSPVRCEWCCI